MRKLPLFSILLTLSACTTLAPAPSQVYQPAGEAAWTFGGELKRTSGVFQPSFDVAITIDGQPALSGPLSGTGTGELAGTFQGKPLQALCAGDERFDWGTLAFEVKQVNCTVLVANTRAATLTFVP